jgi:hypothetical protein
MKIFGGVWNITPPLILQKYAYIILVLFECDGMEYKPSFFITHHHDEPEDVFVAYAAASYGTVIQHMQPWTASN